VRLGTIMTVVALASRPGPQREHRVIRAGNGAPTGVVADQTDSRDRDRQDRACRRRPPAQVLDRAGRA
jgi:hypothetical protein